MNIIKRPLPQQLILQVVKKNVPEESLDASFQPEDAPPGARHPSLNHLLCTFFKVHFTKTRDHNKNEDLSLPHQVYRK